MKRNSDALTQNAKSRTTLVQDKISKAMKLIELEIEQNEGIYPFHGGRLSMAEVCRRAGVHKITMQSPTHKNTTRPMVQRWIISAEQGLLKGRKAVRKKVTERADDWKQRYFSTVRRINEIYAIEIPAKDEALARANRRIGELEAENLAMHAAISQGKVVQISKRKGP